MDLTPKQQLIEDRLGVSLTKYLRDCRKRGLSYRAISDEVKIETGIYVSKTTLHEWAE